MDKIGLPSAGGLSDRASGVGKAAPVAGGKMPAANQTVKHAGTLVTGMMLIRISGLKTTLIGWSARRLMIRIGVWSTRHFFRRVRNSILLRWARWLPRPPLSHAHIQFKPFQTE